MMSGVAADLRWRLLLLAGVAPVFLCGLLASVLADRLIFVGWAFATALAFALALSFEAGGRSSGGGPYDGLSLLGLGLGWLAFGWLTGRHREELDLAFRAFLPAVYHPVLTAPRTGYATGTLFLLAAPLQRLFFRPPAAGRT